ncbi:Pescadillo homolog [Nesidiocoris tenuis]|uniref:Ribosome biogenesis protein BOP1 homolog n=1 Tax=Nesidiocoris tenuis TaxID=355587 RepID=A0ABN7AP95_9HEMI|nr:Pescadillo homolog [Nesidiocoris tenuis]
MGTPQLSKKRKHPAHNNGVAQEEDAQKSEPILDGEDYDLFSRLLEGGFEDDDSSDSDGNGDDVSDNGSDAEEDSDVGSEDEEYSDVGSEEETSECEKAEEKSEKEESGTDGNSNFDGSVTEIKGVSVAEPNEKGEASSALHKTSAGEDEYAVGDTSDEEDIRNTVGNIPINWYDEYDHIGYDWEGKKILKPERGDDIDEFLKKIENPDFWRTVRHPHTGQDVVLSDDDINLIRRLETQKIPDAAFNEYAPWVEWFSSQVLEMPLRKFPEHKRSFLPSKDEMRKVSKYVHALKMGWMKSKKAMKKQQKKAEKQGPHFYLLWKTDDVAEEMRRIENHIPPPKRQLPDHSESYNPPEEYLFNEQEKRKWERERRSMGNKKLHFVPQKYNSLREVPAYKRFIRERFMRCLDLYMCPRAIKMKLTIEPEELVPQLPSPADLQPFPTTDSVYYKGHQDFVRSISVDPTGQFMASASDDGTVKIWEIITGRCLRTIQMGGTARSIAWNPCPTLSLIAIAVDKQVCILNARVGSSEYVKQTDVLISKRPRDDKEVPPRVEAAVQWEFLSDGDLHEQGVLIVIKHFKEVKQVQWHRRGDYFFSLMPDGENRSLLVHRVSNAWSQLPFSRSRGLIQAATFHPNKPLFLVATQRNVRIYDLAKREITKKLLTSSKWIADIAVHPGGDNLIVGTYDRKVLWFDLELSTKPYKRLSLHSQAVRSVAYHSRYPLFATVSDDQSLIVSHGMVYNDLLQNALIVPLKRFSCHKQVSDFSLFSVTFHPQQPWVFTSGADGNIILYT